MVSLASFMEIKLSRMRCFPGIRQNGWEKDPDCTVSAGLICWLQASFSLNPYKLYLQITSNYG